MMSLIEVKCPHCGAQGQILMPPVGAIIVGPCPHCEGMVVVFSGRVFPLDSGIMQGGSLDEKKDHMLDVLGVFLNERIERLLMEPPITRASDDRAEPGDDPDAPDENGTEEVESHEVAPQLPKRRTPGRSPKVPISQDEFDTFVRTDLQLIDNPEYFKAVFS